jgi:hypothetical protein
MSNVLDYQTVTRKYYAARLGCSELEFSSGVSYICSTLRDSRQPGHSYRYPLCICKTDRAVIVSYSAAFQKQVELMKESFLKVQDYDPFPLERLESLFTSKIQRNVCFVFNHQIPVSVAGVVSLTRNDYRIFLEFAQACGGAEWDGMKEYFGEIVANGYCIAKMADGKAVSVSDTPDIPDMADVVREVSVNTLPGHRRRGYARAVASACISKILADRKCPQWMAEISNFASHKLAFSLGFKYFGDFYFLPSV